MISYDYPPIKNVGGLRSYYFSLYLQTFMWNVFVVTANNKTQGIEPCSDEPQGSLASYFSKNSLPLNKFACRYKLFIPDLNIGWILSTFELCKKIIKKEEINVVYATCNPFSSALVGALIKKLLRVPLLLDFRDPWTLDYDVIYPTFFHKLLDNMLESYVLKNVDHLVVVTKDMKNKYIEKYNFLKDKISVITNGFDVHSLPNQHLPLFDKFTITYGGSFSGLRRPDLFLYGLKKAITKKAFSPNNFEVLFLGPRNNHLSHLIKNLHLEQFVSNLGFLPNKTVLNYLFQSHMLLLVEPRPALTTKVFEYLATGHSILALVSRGELTQLVEEYSGVSYVLTSGCYEDVAEAICDCYDKWAKNRYELSDPDKIETFKQTYNRRALSEHLVSILDSLI